MTTPQEFEKFLLFGCSSLFQPKIFILHLSLKNSDKALWKNRSAFTQEVELALQMLARRDGLSIE